jgi:branched-chain amino acid transport system ATP-binding protein
MPAASLDVESLSAGYGQTRVIESVSFSVPAGGRLAVFGRNGVGKTTLLATLMGLSTTYTGNIRLNAADISGQRTSTRAAAGLGYVPQTRDVFPSLTVEENLFVGLKGRSRSALDEAYQLFPRLQERRRNLGSQLSGGEQQMLSIARTLLGQPTVLLLDEPMEGLAPVICDEIMSSLVALARDSGATIVLVEQQIERALDFAEDVLLMERGRVGWFGSGAELRSNHTLIDRYIGISLH